MMTGSVQRVAAMAAIMAMRWSLWLSTTAPPGRVSRPVRVRLSGALRYLRPQGGEHVGHGGEPVALLHPQPGGVGEGG